MHAPASPLWLGASLLICGACGQSETHTPGGAAGQASGGSSAAQAGAAAAGKAGAGASGSANGGATTGGSPSGGDSSGGTSTGGAPTAGASTAGDGGEAGLVDCDERKVVCKRARPQCGTFEVPSVEGNCYGECVNIERCACDSAEACPNPNEFTCWNNVKHCGPFVR